MSLVNLRALVGKLNPLCRRTLEAAAGLCLSRSNYSIEIVHWLIKLLEITPSDLTLVFKHYGINSSQINRELVKWLDSLKTGNADKPDLAPSLPKWLREAWLLASVDFNVQQIRSGFMLAALLTEEDLAEKIKDRLPTLARIPRDNLLKELRTICKGSPENEGELHGERPAAAGGEPGTAGTGAPAGQQALSQYTINLTERAAKGEIDPVIGRDFEIRQLIDILTRRRQNNPILTGEAGVGKTAVVEGFAQRIVAGDVPTPLRGVVVRILDLGLLQAGAGMKGEFEARLKAVLNEVKASPVPIILFIDEAHTLIGAGGAAGQGDAANLLKPALARGELRTIAATTRN